ncbi:unnamed protein product [Linum trigynum]|uniref:DNA-directed RNA polymerase III subunit n=1 Tax=Linum trigynum TaxID=586398 RepID=A0AAV2GEK0_9ROSI
MASGRPYSRNPSRGRGRGGPREFHQGEPYILFPEVKLPDPKNVKEEKNLVVVNAKFQAFWKASCYYLEEATDAGPKKSWSMEVERFADRGKPKVTSKRSSLDEFLQFGSYYFPKELVGGKKVVRRSKKARWDQAMDALETLEDKEAKKKAVGGQEKEGEEEEEEEEVETFEEEDFSDDDYNQNEYFDDDEDDFNVDAGDDEGPLY